MQQYSNIEDESLKDFTSKHGILFVQTTRRVITCTVKALQQKLNEKFQLDVSTGTIVSLKPFYMTYATENEIVLCMCKLCLNTRLFFNVVKQEIPDENETISTFL